MIRIVLSLLLFFTFTAIASADGLVPVTDKTQFEDLVRNRELTTLGVKLVVTSDGAIQGKAFGMNVTGAWDWKDGYFCRDLTLGQDQLAANCQLVTAAGDRIRFTSDFGQGESASLRLK